MASKEKLRKENEELRLQLNKLMEETASMRRSMPQTDPTAPPQPDGRPRDNDVDHFADQLLRMYRADRPATGYFTNIGIAQEQNANRQAYELNQARLTVMQGNAAVANRNARRRAQEQAAREWLAIDGRTLPTPNAEAERPTYALPREVFGHWPATERNFPAERAMQEYYENAVDQFPEPTQNQDSEEVGPF